MDLGKKIKRTMLLLILSNQLKDYIQKHIEIDQIFDNNEHYLLFKISPLKLLDLIEVQYLQ